MTFRSDATEGVWSPTQNVAVQTEANVVAIFFFHQCGFYDPTHHIRGCQKIIWNFALKGRALIRNHLNHLFIIRYVRVSRESILKIFARRARGPALLHGFIIIIFIYLYGHTRCARGASARPKGKAFALRALI